MRAKAVFYNTCLAVTVLTLCLRSQSAFGFVTVSVAPAGETVLVGSNVVFTAQVTPTAGETITGYAWQSSPNVGGPFTVIQGATTSTLSLPNVQTAATGYYFAQVTYNSGSDVGLVSVSTAVALVVNDQARIVSQPQGGLIRITGSSASFSVSALGTPPPAYQWRLNGVNVANGAHIAGATSSTLALDTLAVAQSGSYDVVVTNLYAAATSQVATLSVYAPPGIAVQPPNTSVLLGSNASLSVTPSGTPPLSYCWRKDGVSLSDGGRISGAATSALAISATVSNDTAGYSVVITNPVGSVTSSVATLTVLVPAIFTSSTSVTGRQGLYLTFTNTAVGTTPILFGAQDLPEGLSIEPTNGVISGVPAVSGDFAVTVFATNAAMTTTGQLDMTLTTGIPGINSALNVNGKQGQSFSYSITASNDPVSFSVDVLPTGLSFDPTNGIISGVPLVNGVYLITVGATNLYGGDSEALTLTLTSSVPGITSPLTASGKQGNSFSYTIRGSDSPTNFSASTLPYGLSFYPSNGVISGVPIVSGVFPIAITASNQFGGDAQVLTLNLSSAIPQITSSRTATGTENTAGFSYTIRANNSPISYGASGLPTGLTVNPATGVISGTPWYGGTFNAVIWAVNAWGTGSNSLVVTINYATLSGFAITDVLTNWSKPYILDFSFSLRDGNSPTSNPVVLPPSKLQVTCWENGVQIPTEAPLILESVLGTGSKQLKTFFALDYTYSMFAVPGAISNMEWAADLLINQEPPHAMFGVIEFNADYMDPQFVTNSMTSPGNYFITDKSVLTQSIAGIQATYVQGNYAGTRCWDAMYAALQAFGPNNVDEQRYLVAMTDGNDDSSLLNSQFYPTSAPDELIKTANNNNVAIYCVGLGASVNTAVLNYITSSTGGHYYLAATTADLPGQFQRIQKDIACQYQLRWATLQRAAVPPVLSPPVKQASRFQPLNPLIPDCPAGFQPSFQITYGNLTASWNTTNVPQDFAVGVDTNQTPAETNYVTATLVQYPFNPPDWTNDVRVGSLRLVQDADIGPQTIRLRASYVPRSVRELQFQYRPNFPCTASLSSTGTNEILFGWTMSETVDTNGVRTLTLFSSNPTDLFTSIPYAAFGDLVEFDFTYPESVTATQAFSLFTNINTIYSNTNMLPIGQSFTNQNFASFIKVYPQAPPHGTPIPWLNYYGFKTNYAAVELIATNGLPVWQDYVAGLNPTNANSRFSMWTAFPTNRTPPQIVFTTVPTRTYWVETSTTLTNWMLLRDNMPGTGGNILFIDNRVLSGVNSVFYRVGVH
jgi:Putative Ig domain/Immunoglobulin I-set domain/von Willebrand factor type A domain